MQLSRILVKDFKKVKSAEIFLGSTNILVGANGSGKSSVLQALHLASCMARQADRVERDKPNTVSITEVDYLPTNRYKKLGHNGDWGNRSESSCSVVHFGFSDGATDITSEITLRSARNAGISISGLIPPAVQPLLRAKGEFFSCYVPGLSGIPNSEKKESKRVVLRASSFGDSNVYLRNVLLLLKNEKPDTIEKIEGHISELIDDIKIVVEHDNEKDLEIRCYFEQNGTRNQIELLGTGYLQIIQMLSYIYLFQPKLLLIDEPDTHLHPSAQERLVAMLEGAAEPFKTKIVMSTHSPFIVRGATANSKVYWLENGCVLMESRTAVERALGWGAMGKKLLLISEDANLGYLRQIIRQWPDIERQVAILPGTGFRHLPSPEQAEDLYAGLERSIRIAILRDSDGLQEREKDMIKLRYDSDHIRFMFTQNSDIEHYTCQAGVLSRVSGRPEEEVRAVIRKCIETKKIDIRDMFVKRRKAHNDELYHCGGSPSTDSLWESLGGASERTVKGKFLLGQIMNSAILPSPLKAQADLVAKACDGTLALDLKSEIESFLGA